MATSELRVGLIGLDTSHAPAFTRLLNDAEHAHHIAGARVVAAYPGGSADWPVSIGRVEGFTGEVAALGVEILDSPEAVAEGVDLVLMPAVDGRKHRELVERVLPAGRPIFVDKPFAVSAADARAMIEAAEKAGVALMSCSPLRYAGTFTAALQALGGPAGVTGIDVHGPLNFEEPLPGLFWYGCHCVEMIVAATAGVRGRVRCDRGRTAELFTFEFEEGRLASYRGITAGKTTFAGVVHGAEGSQPFTTANLAKPFYASMLQAILETLPAGATDVPVEQMLTVVTMMEAGNTAREADGWVAFDGTL